MMKLQSATIALITLSVASVLAPSVTYPAATNNRSAGEVAQPFVLMPDLIVDSRSLGQNLKIRTEKFTASQCDVVEDGISSGSHAVMRFTVSTPNVGDAALQIGDPNYHYYTLNDGLFEFAPCHGHFHYRHYATYELIDPVSGYSWRAAKRGFCMIDVAQYQPSNVRNSSKPVYTVCGSPGVTGNQGISAGFADVYDWQLQGQYFVLDGGDGQPPVPPGNYFLRITVNPPFVAQAGENCPYTDTLGLCHQLPESDYSNNVSQIVVSVPRTK